VDSSKTNWLTTSAILLVLLGLLAGGIYGLVLLVGQAIRLDKEVSAALIVAAVSLASVLISRHLEKRQTTFQELRARKIPVYQEFMEVLFSRLLNPNAAQTDDSELTEALKVLTPKMMAWAADDVIARWANWRLLGAETTDVQRFIDFEGILLAIRKDTGHDNKNLPTGMLLSLFINDIWTVLTPEVLKAQKSRSRRSQS
jgi:hypothetical protein